jgi:hypothetical protein
MSPAKPLAFFLGHPAPDAVVLVRCERPLEALGSDGAMGADGLGSPDLVKRRAGGANGEEQIGFLPCALRLMNPIQLPPPDDAHLWRQ